MKKLLLAVLPLLPVAAFADSKDEALSALPRCSAITDAKAQLACYNAVVPQARSALGTPAPVAKVMPPAPAPSAAIVPTAAPAPMATPQAPPAETAMAPSPAS